MPVDTTTLDKDKLAYSVPEIMHALVIRNKNKVYELFHTGELESFTIGRRRFSSRGALDRLVRRREKAARSQPILPRTKNGKGR